jgi:hypothetical protein
MLPGKKHREEETAPERFICHDGGEQVCRVCPAKFRDNAAEKVEPTPGSIQYGSNGNRT